MTGKTILLAVTGSISAYKAAEVASRLTQNGAIVPVILTEAARRFVAPLTFQALTHQPVYTSLWPEDSASEAGVAAAMAHIGLAERADAILIAPTSVNCMARLAAGFADDLLSTVVVAAHCPILLAPAMNPAMWTHPATQRNRETLADLGYHIIDPELGRMACEHVGIGRLPATEILLNHLHAVLMPAKQDLKGRRALITAGPTREALDPVRYISNHSSGKMGYELAEAAIRRGAEVILISGPVHLTPPHRAQVKTVVSTQEMFEVTTRYASQCDIIIASAAPADFRPTEMATQKIKKQGDALLTLDLAPNPDIIAHIGSTKRQGQIIVAFAAETENVLAEARRKMAAKNADAIVANDVTATDAGFNVDTNRVTWVSKREEDAWPLLSKTQVAERVWDKIVAMF